MTRIRNEVLKKSNIIIPNRNL